MVAELPSLRPRPAPRLGMDPDALADDEALPVASEPSTGGVLGLVEAVLAGCFAPPRIRSENAVVFLPAVRPTGAGGSVGCFLGAALLGSSAGCGSSLFEESGGVSSATSPFYTKFRRGGAEAGNNFAGSKLAT